MESRKDVFNIIQEAIDSNIKLEDIVKNWSTYEQMLISCTLKKEFDDIRKKLEDIYLGKIIKIENRDYMKVEKVSSELRDTVICGSTISTDPTSRLFRFFGPRISIRNESSNSVCLLDYDGTYYGGKVPGGEYSFVVKDAILREEFEIVTTEELLSQLDTWEKVTKNFISNIKSKFIS